ncbi:helix-turn-helix transcriptional regulator [Streptomyces sp. NBC_01637]|uniref:AraC family transcriptional regulator n=1 Tax=unclassified Streptomyces TaxID=2593676 RepID=UPI003862DF43|nr:helix-turn-helix transcriptional regulator [Streptomyces sp. NBC_01653]WTC84551.1 helix-turn-helix transcriptional regulator [Streptomyces sp. NBC_01653]WTD86316.1 helix-turn-helix transcriptional regulator [Streptomyces sp. NBC_01637]WTD94208.1 helix-turn-helix transcriptional regulator [Streptomyces sp. NBC_01637]
MSDLELEDIGDSRKNGERATDFKSSINLSARQIRDTGHIFRDWEGGPFSHLTHLSIPQPSAYQGFKFSANGHLFESLLSVKVYCDSLTGVSGNDLDEDPVVADLVTSGRIVFTGKRVSHAVTPGAICIRDTKASWEFSCAPGTRVRVISIPRHLVFSRIGLPGSLNRAYISDITAPEVRFLVNFLEAIEKSSDDLDRSTSTQNIALDTCASLFSGMLSDRSDRPNSTIQDHPNANATMKAAQNVIEKSLDRHDLSPAMIAQMVGVSVRTLHRSFSESNDSIMAFTRRRRLQKAHGELMRLGSEAKISEIAARWHFADASHFIRHFKSFYGATPAAYLKNNGRAGHKN